MPCSIRQMVKDFATDPFTGHAALFDLPRQVLAQIRRIDAPIQT